MHQFIIDEEVIQHMVENNGFNYNIHKASEEFIELGLVLIQKITKPKKVENKEIIDEIGDCITRLNVLLQLFPKEEIQARIDSKMNNYKQWINEKTYKHI